MIGGVYSESDLSPGILPVSEEVLFGDVVSAEPVGYLGDHKKAPSISVRLPHGCHATGGLGFLSGENGSRVFLDTISVGDARLIGSGTGSRLIKAFAALAVASRPDCETMHTGWVRLGAINAIEKVFPGQMRVELGSDKSLHYGFGTGRSLEQMLTDHPARTARPFRAWATTTKIQ